MEHNSYDFCEIYLVYAFNVFEIKIKLLKQYSSICLIEKIYDTGAKDLSNQF